MIHHTNAVSDSSETHILWVKTRIEFLQSKIDFTNKAVLELGAFRADIGRRLTKLGAKVTCVEGKPQLARYIAEKGDVELIIADLDKPIWPFQNHYDIILHMGLLYHQQNPEYLLLESQRHCDVFVLESQVIDSDEEILEITPPDNFGLGQGINGEARPSIRYIENRLVNAQRYDDHLLNSGNHHYSWKSENNKSYITGRRRLWIGHPCIRTDSKLSPISEKIGSSISTTSQARQSATLKVVSSSTQSVVSTPSVLPKPQINSTEEKLIPQQDL